MELTNQELAKAINKLNWGGIQMDTPEDGSALVMLKEELMKRDKEKAVDILFAVLEAQNLPDDFMGKDKIMYNFDNL